MSERESCYYFFQITVSHYFYLYLSVVKFKGKLSATNMTKLKLRWQQLAKIELRWWGFWEIWRSGFFFFFDQVEGELNFYSDPEGGGGVGGNWDFLL